MSGSQVALDPVVSSTLRSCEFITAWQSSMQEPRVVICLHSQVAWWKNVLVGIYKPAIWALRSDFHAISASDAPHFCKQK